MTASQPPPDESRLARIVRFCRSREGLLVTVSFAAILLHVVLALAGFSRPGRDIPLIIATVFGAVPILFGVAKSLIARNPGADVLAAVSIVAGAALGEWFVAAVIVLMLSGGEALEKAATARSSAVLGALAKRAPSLAHRLGPDGALSDVPVENIAVGERVVVLPHEICPVDGVVVEGQGGMDESFLTGEPYAMTKSVGSSVLSGAMNAATALTVEALNVAAQSRYSQIVSVLTAAESRRAPMRRMADRLGAWYAPLALALGLVGWAVSGEASRFLAVVVIATPCPLLIGVPVAMMGAISLAAQAGIIVKDPSVLERVSLVRTILFDKTGTLTYGKPALVETHVAADSALSDNDAISLAAALENYSRHPLASAFVEHARANPGQFGAANVSRVSELPGEGLSGVVDGRQVLLTSRNKAAGQLPQLAQLPEAHGGMECVMLVNGDYAASFRFRDMPRPDAQSFVSHLRPHHGVGKTIMISGDGSAETAHIASAVGLDEVHAGCTPEEKLAIVRRETAIAPTLFVGDGLNDAPAMTAATVGVAFGSGSDVTSESAGAVVLDSSLSKTDELFHIGARFRAIALQSVIGGMVLSVLGMGFAVFGLLPPMIGAIAQEVIDVAAVLNAARVSMRRKALSDISA